MEFMLNEKGLENKYNNLVVEQGDALNQHSLGFSSMSVSHS